MLHAMSENCEGGYNINSMKYSGHYHVAWNSNNITTQKVTMLLSSRS